MATQCYVSLQEVDVKSVAETKQCDVKMHTLFMKSTSSFLSLLLVSNLLLLQLLEIHVDFHGITFAGA